MKQHTDEAKFPFNRYTCVSVKVTMEEKHEKHSNIAVGEMQAGITASCASCFYYPMKK